MSAAMTRRPATAVLGLALALAACAGGAPSVKPEPGDRDEPPASPPTSTPAATSTATRPAGGTSTPGSGKEATSAPQVAAPPPRRELSPKAQRLFDEAVAAQEEMKRLQVPTDWETLERRWRAVTEAEPVPEAWFNLGVALERRRQVDPARASYRRALELDPELARAATNLALLDEPRDPRQAAEQWAALARRFPDDPLPRARLAALYEQSGQKDEAWRLAREALVRDPRAIAAYKVMMRVALERGQIDLAHLLAIKAQKLDDADPEVVAFVGDVLRARKDEPGALAQWRKAIQLKDDFAPARHALLAHDLSRQLWDDVAEQARAILRSDPTDARVQLVLGIAYRHLGKPDQALAAYDQAERLGGGRLPEVHLARGVALMKSKEQCEPAIGELRRYVAAAGPAVASEGPAMRLMRECEGLLASAKEAEDAARQMKAEADREAAGKAEEAGQKPSSPAASEGKPAPDHVPPAAPAAAAASASARQGPTR
jgi:Flp pilus assembly protein TadD